MKTNDNTRYIDERHLAFESQRVDFSHISEENEETPVIFIEREDDSLISNAETPKLSYGRRSKIAMLIIAIIFFVAMTGAGIAVFIYNRHTNIGIPISCTPAQNIEKLKTQTLNEVQSEVVLTSDTILGVGLNFYEMRGLRAELSLEEPDTLDKSVYLYSRSADHTADGNYIGSLVMNGKEMQSDLSRIGYCAMLGNNMVVGVSPSEDVKDFVQEQGGSFFRQFILVSNGIIPNRFYLHGKVERRGLGRINDTYYYIETLNKETLWDFADALREYGFTDAIYITGGTDYCFYRTADGVRHDIGSPENYPHKKWKGVIPWLVFRKK